MAMIVGVSIGHMTNQLVHRAIVHLANLYSGRRTALQCFCKLIEPLLDIFYQQIPYFLDQTPRLLLISSFAGVRLLIEGGSYSRAAFINFEATPLGDIDTIDSIFRDRFSNVGDR